MIIFYEKLALFSVYPYKDGVCVEIYFQWMNMPPFVTDEKQSAVIRELNKINGISIPKEKIHKRPWFYLELIRDVESFDKFVDVFAELIEEYKLIDEE